MALYLKEPGSTITHFIGMIMSIASSFFLMEKALRKSSMLYFVSALIFMLSMILLYTASTLYHSFNLSLKANTRLKKFDHMMIFILIAGTYTPICLLVLEKQAGQFLLILIWSIAILGILLKAFWVFCPKWFSSILYIAMGWLCIFSSSQLLTALPTAGFAWLLAGGIIYTLGGIIYALKIPAFDKKHKYFGIHEIFHLFVMGGSFCHIVLIYLYVL